MTAADDAGLACTVYRCGRQDEMYLYLRAGMAPDQLPATLRERLGRLTQAMELTLSPQRRLARADIAQVILHLQRDGWYLQLPPDGHINAHLYFGD